MKIVRYKFEDKIYWGIVDSDNSIKTNLELTSNINSFDEVIKLFNDSKEELVNRVSLDDVQLLAPVLPTKISCVSVKTTMIIY